MAASIVATYTSTDSTADKSITGISWNAGDAVVVIAGTGGENSHLNLPTNANLTFSQKAIGGAQDSGNLEGVTIAWGATAASSQTSQTIAVTETGSAGQPFIAEVWVIRPGAGETIGFGSASGNVTESTISLAVSAGSTVCYLGTDWNADAAGRSPATGSGTATERLDATLAATYTYYAADWVGVSAGTFGFGMSSYTGWKVAHAALEVTSTTSGATGTAAVTLGAATSSASGSSTRGTAAVTLGTATSTASGGHGVAGTASPTLAAATSSGSGSSTRGTAAVTLGAATSTASGTHSISGTVAVTLAAATSSAVGSSTTGTAAVTLAAATSTATGQYGNTPTGTAAITLGAATSSASGSSVTGSAAVTLTAATSTATGSHGVAGTVAVTLAAATSTATGSYGSNPVGTAAVTLGAATSSATGTHSISGTAAITLAAASSSGAGSQAFGSAAVTLSPATSSATGSRGATGSVAVTLGAATSSATGVAGVQVFVDFLSEPRAYITFSVTARPGFETDRPRTVFHTTGAQ